MMLLFIVSPHEKEFGIQEIFAIGIRNPVDWNPESTLIWNPESDKVWNPKSTCESILKPFANNKIIIIIIIIIIILTTIIIIIIIIIIVIMIKLTTSERNGVERP